jgi:hypothetical protein
MLKKLLQTSIQTISEFYCIWNKLALPVYPNPYFVLWNGLDPEPFSDAELELCKDLLHPKGYTLIRKEEGSEIVLYRLLTPEEEETLKEQAIPILKQLT